MHAHTSASVLPSDLPPSQGAGAAEEQELGRPHPLSAGVRPDEQSEQGFEDPYEVLEEEEEMERGAEGGGGRGEPGTL